jgi:hypothetical protein
MHEDIPGRNVEPTMKPVRVRNGDNADHFDFALGYRTDR